MKYEVISWLYSTHLPDGVQIFDRILEKAICSALNYDTYEAEQYVEKNKKAYWNDFVKLINQDIKNNIYPLAKIIDHNSRRFESFSSWLLKKSNKKYYRLSERLRLRPYVYKQIESMNDREFEAVCCLACKANGAIHTQITPRKGEGGIDFYALIDIPRGYMRCTGMNSMRIIGQAKKHKNPVPVNLIHQFNDSLGDVRRRSESIKDQIPDWFFQKFTPIVGWIFGHNGFQSGSNSQARMKGIMLYDSQTLTEMIVLSPNVCPGDEGTLFAKKIKTRCHDILRESKN